MKLSRGLDLHPHVLRPMLAILQSGWAMRRATVAIVGSVKRAPFSATSFG